MRITNLAVALGLLALHSSPAHAQRTLAQDTMSASTPVALSCGFCALEAYGVVFREVGSGGLTALDFPLTLESVSLALGDADVSADGTTCSGRTTGGVALVHVEVWAGAAVPSGDPRTFPAVGEPWAGETFVYAADDVPVMLSVPRVEGESRFDLMLNTFEVLGEAGEPIVVPEGSAYLRAVVSLASNGMHNAVCAGALETPFGFPVRDDDGRIGDERGFIYAGGYGWAWNEALPGGGAIDGDWGIRLTVLPMPVPRDAGSRSDAGAAGDGGGDAPGDGSIDASGSADAGGTPPGGTACGCRVAGGRPAARVPGIAAALGLLVGASRARRRRRLG